MTSNPTPAIDRIPLAHSVRYVARGLPEVPNQYGPGVLAPSEITLTYRSASDSGLGRVHAYVAGRIWVDGVELPLLSGGLYGQHYDEGLSNWPEWLAEEARLHDPAAVPSVSAVDQTTRDRIAEALSATDRQFLTFALDLAADQMASRGDEFDADDEAALEQLRRLADEAQQPETQTGCDCPDEDAVEHGFGVDDCTCIPFTRQETPPRYLNRPTDTVDMISGWERGRDCPHHGRQPAVGARQPDTETPGCPDPIECSHEAALGQARETNRRLNLRAQRLESELAAYRRAVSQWDVSERGTYIPHASLRTIGLASGKDILGSVRHLKHFQRVEQAEAAIERVERLALTFQVSGNEFIAEQIRTALGAQQQPVTQTPVVRHAPGKVILCPDCRAKGNSVCTDGEEECCGVEPPSRADDPNSRWGDCWCTRSPGHDGEHRCEPCSERHGAPGWSDAFAVPGRSAATSTDEETSRG